MNIQISLIAFSLVTASALAAGLPAVPSEPIAAKQELLFSDDFKGAEHDQRWHRVVDTFAFESGALKGMQTREKDAPSKDGKSVIKAHAAVYGLELPTKDSVVECKVRFDGATMMDVEFDDRKFTGSHYGHICRAQLRLNGVTIIDEKDGGMRNDIHEMNQDPTKKAEIARLLVGRSVTYPAKFETGKSYALVVETVGAEMRVSIDGKPVAYLRSSGIAHPTKSKIELGVAGKSGWFEEIKVWNAEPVKR